jgi:YidC/Oxa1 family membrane protein insertase
MDKKKLIIFLVGFAVFYFAYYKLILEPIEKQNAAAQRAARARQKAAAPAVPKVPPKSPSSPAAVPVRPAPASGSEPQKTIVIDTSLYRAEFTNKGAVLTSFKLKRYTDDYRGSLEMIPQGSHLQVLPLAIDVDDRQLRSRLNDVVYRVQGDNARLRGANKTELVFLYSDASYSIEKRFQFTGDSYLIQSNVQVIRGGQPVPARITWSPGLETSRSYKDRQQLRPSRSIVNTGQQVEHYEPKDVKEFKKIGTTVRWAGVENNYFLAVFIPQHSADAYMLQPQVTKNDIHNVTVFVGPAASKPLELTLFVGPKDYVLLSELGADLRQAVSFGFFGPIAKGLFFALRFFYKFTGNYGWAIVLLTILVKIIFTPFTQKSFTSMKKMQQMQPEMKKIQEKYGRMKNDDPRKQNMNVEIMQLHKRHGVNPLGGCLPMLLQMPVLFAFYSLLSNAIELRKAPFVLWLQDLSRPDPLFVTPLLMGATMLLQQRMTPITDPTQKTMMYIMPVMFTFMSFQLQSGLVLYWLLSNVLAIAHQYYFQRQQKPLAVKPSHA